MLRMRSAARLRMASRASLQLKAEKERIESERLKNSLERDLLEADKATQQLFAKRLSMRLDALEKAMGDELKALRNGLETIKPFQENDEKEDERKADEKCEETKSDWEQSNSLPCMNDDSNAWQMQDILEKLREYGSEIENLKGHISDFQEQRHGFTDAYRNKPVAIVASSPLSSAENTNRKHLHVVTEEETLPASLQSPSAVEESERRALEEALEKEVEIGNVRNEPESTPRELSCASHEELVVVTDISTNSPDNHKKAKKVAFLEPPVFKIPTVKVSTKSRSGNVPGMYKELSDLSSAAAADYPSESDNSIADPSTEMPQSIAEEELGGPSTVEPGNSIVTPQESFRELGKTMVL
mmetsp:Transcript_12659/g.23948  ORF Transcript_12659/g.23948 Transcript_12659/m.23948 type:complete len:357 (+) Transcript_12659:39-1109(+)